MEGKNDSALGQISSLDQNHSRQEGQQKATQQSATMKTLDNFASNNADSKK